jgi:hypothetical protein
METTNREIEMMLMILDGDMSSRQTKKKRDGEQVAVYFENFERSMSIWLCFHSSFTDLDDLL